MIKSKNLFSAAAIVGIFFVSNLAQAMNVTEYCAAHAGSKLCDTVLFKHIMAEEASGSKVKAGDYLAVNAQLKKANPGTTETISK